MRVAALADVHANAPALAAVLAEVERERPDVVVFCGDLTWGPLPGETLDLVRGLALPARFVRGNADRALTEEDETPRGSWLRAEHSDEDLAFLATFEPTVTLEVEGVGRTCFCHGSPRSDEECVTDRTPPERVRALTEGLDVAAVATAHVHLQYDRSVAGVRLFGPGSVGLPNAGEPGLAHWALVGPGVDLRRTRYDLDAAIADMRATEDPGVEGIVERMLRPPGHDEVVEHAERHVYAG